MELTEKEKRFIKYNQTHYRVYIFLFVFIFLFATLQFHLIFKKFIPVYTTAFQETPEIKDFVRFGLIKVVSFSFVWIALLIGLLWGEFCNYRKTKLIINKLMH